MRPMLPALLLFGCAQGGPSPLIEAHRGGAGYWPENSRTAMLGALGAGFDGIELDLVLTADGVPVLSHDPWVHETLCTTVDGSPLEERALVRDLTLDELLEGYRCGGVPDPEMPQAVVVADTVMTLDELLLAVREGPSDVLVHLDIKQEPGLTDTADVFAEAILSRWFAADLPNPWYVSSNLPEVTAAFESWGRAQGRDVTTSLAWPRFVADRSTTVTALEHEALSLLGAEDWVEVAAEADADGLAVAWQVAELHRVRAAKAAGLQVQLWTVNDPGSLAFYARWPLDTLITDYPGDAP